MSAYSGLGILPKQGMRSRDNWLAKSRLLERSFTDPMDI